MKSTAILSLPLPKKQGDKIAYGNLVGSSLAFTLAELCLQTKSPILTVVADTPSALKLEQEVRHFLGDDKPLITFPDWETLPYDNFSPHQDIISQRIHALHRFQQTTSGLIIVSVSTLMQRIAPVSFLDQHSLIVKTGDKIDMHAMRQRLETSGYNAVDQVLEHGEFSARGSILDLYPMGSTSPFRIDFFDDEVEEIRGFNTETQRSEGVLEAINLLPAHEFPTDAKAIELFRQQFRTLFTPSREAESVYQQVSKGFLPTGIEYYHPLFLTETATLFDYLPKQLTIVQVGELYQASEVFFQDVEKRYEDRRHDIQRPLLAPSALYLPVSDLFQALGQYSKVSLSNTLLSEKAGNTNLGFRKLPEISVNHQKKTPLAPLLEFIAGFDGKIIFSVESEGRRETLLELLEKTKLKPKAITTIAKFLKAKPAIGIWVSQCENSFIIDDLNVAIICENELLGHKIIQRRRTDKKVQANNDALVRNLTELSIGQPVVHIEHGVGRYLGLQIIENAGMATEFLTLEYANAAKLYVPVSALHLISRYSGAGESSAPLHKLGSDSWEKSKTKAMERVRDVAAELLDIYAQRAAKSGFQYKCDKESYLAFADGFPYEETDDQKTAIQAVMDDMRQDKTMDRLVCGDVGFGKTEVAMRAAFMSIMNDKQVAVLVPTTLLAQQHFENFKDRFANWPVRVEVISRFKTAKEQKLILEDVKNGKVDLLIGTHKLLSNKIEFSDLGLLIIDEEHRFGVRQKEKVKALRADIDILTLTATPIPRTLNMAMNGMRDLSIIATPPAKRLAVKTFVRQYDDNVVKEAIMREIMRGGQVYFLHNNVDSIDKTAEAIAQLIPEARVITAHGQMAERELESVMSDFYHQRFNVLVCTTIIETGIDIPTANTIIMDRADNLGLAQLHQLRGRVGRSHHQAYAYLLTPHPKRITSDAKKRLEAIASLEDLGAGFTLATHDLEIRGAGELLGDEQSGQISSIGFSLYMDMLDQAVKSIKEGRSISLEEALKSQTEIELRVPALLPDDYIHDVNMRLSIYKRIASCQSENQLREVQVELIDRFGLLPDNAKNLIRQTELKLQAAPLGIKRLEIGPAGGYISFGEDNQVDVGYLIRLIQQQPRVYSMDGPSKLKFAIKSPDAKDRVQLVESMLVEFAKNKIAGVKR
ncbi:transcription-repair coupling factor [Moritella marina]|uniref:transcription-repair coupling factor n=1 Tax=Moritella marina TaxID=90736 RepID=UPI003704CA48